jgi:hypothetical protein
MRFYSLVMPFFVLLTAQVGTLSYALTTDQAEALDVKVRAAAGRALVNAEGDIKVLIEHVQVVQSPRPSYALLQLGNFSAQSAILDEMILPDLMKLLSYDTDRLATSAVDINYIDSNFSDGVLGEISSAGKSYGFLFDRAHSESEWLRISLRANYSLQVMRYLATRRILRWIPYQGERDSSGNLITLLGAVNGDEDLMKMGQMVSSWNTPVHELASDPQMAEAIKTAYENSKRQILGKMSESATRLNVSSPTRALVQIHRPVSFVAYGFHRRFLSACEKLLSF